MTEAELDAAVAGLCEVLGVQRYHSHDSRRSIAGWPDLVLWGEGGILFRELKSADGRLSREQVDVLASLQAAGADVDVWRPGDWFNGTITRQLRRVAALRDYWPGGAF